MSTNYQPEFASALFDPRQAVPAVAVDPQGHRDDKRFAVYRNNVISSLTEAIEEGFPTVKKLVGDEFSRAMAQEFVRNRPPQSPLMIYYGEGYNDFIRAFPPASTVPYLGDIAAIEFAQRRAYYADDTPILPANWWDDVDPDRIALLTLDLHQSVQMIASDMPIYDIWWRNAVDENHDIETAGQGVLIDRRADSVRTQIAPKGAKPFLDAIMMQRSIGDAANDALAIDSNADIAALVAYVLTVTTQYK